MSDDDPQIRAYDRHGEKITIAKSEIGKLYALGGKVATKAEGTAHDLEQQYQAQGTAEKITGAAKFLGPLGWAANLANGGMAPPTLEAYGEGVQQGATAGFGASMHKAAIGAIHGQPEAQAYADRTDQLETAHPTAHAAGEVVGMVAPALVGAAGAIAPAGAISALGAGVEAGVGAAGRALGYEGASALGRAGMAAAQLGARGAVEGGAFGASQYAGDALLHDVPMTTDKLFAATGTGALWGAGGGALLGAAGSLAASGASAAGSAVRSGLARAMAPAEAVAGDGLAAAKSVTESIASGETAQTSAMSGKLKDYANKFAVDALGATKVQARNALEHVAGKEGAVGEYLNRIGFKPDDGQGFVSGAVGAGKAGRADDWLATIQADKAGRIATGLDESIKGIPARVSVDELTGHAVDLFDAMTKDPTKIAGADTFLARVKLETQAISNAGRVAADGTMDAADAFYLRSGLAKQAYELGRASGAAGDAYKDFLRKWDGTTIRALDEAAEKAGKNGIGDKIRYWKREWQLASAAEEMAEGGAERVAHNNNFGIREGIGAAVGVATGHPIMGLATLVGGKIAKERGMAVAAYTMNQMADRGVLTKWVQKIDDQIGKASKGLIAPPAKGLLNAKDKMPPTKELAKTALLRVAEFKADPEAYIDKATRQTESMASHSPELASALVARSVQAANFLSSKVPQVPDPDPLDPHPAPRMTPNEQAEFGRFAWYVDKPSRFFAEVARGKVTYEGAETAQALAPGAFQQLQERTMEALAADMAKGNRIPFRQRQIIGVLMDVAATPSQRADHAAFLQKNVLDSEPTAPAPKRSGSPSTSTQRSALDRLEADGPGRR